MHSRGCDMAIETYGLTAATLEPYLTQLYGQYGNAGDGLSDTDVDTIIEDQAARVGAAIIKALGADGITNVAGDELQEIAQGLGLSTSGLKSEILDRIKQHLGIE